MVAKKGGGKPRGYQKSNYTSAGRLRRNTRKTTFEKKLKFRGL